MQEAEQLGTEAHGIDGSGAGCTSRKWTGSNAAIRRCRGGRSLPVGNRVKLVNSAGCEIARDIRTMCHQRNGG
jgi:hypothetical protein